MDGTLMNKLHGHLSLLSEKSMKILVKYYETGILTLKEHSLLLNDLTKERDTLKEQPLQNKKTLIPHQEIIYRGYYKHTMVGRLH